MDTTSVSKNVNQVFRKYAMRYLINTPTNAHTHIYMYILFWRYGPTRAMASSFLRFLDHKQRRITVGRTPLDKWSARCRDLCLKTHNTHNRLTSMPRWDSNPQSQQASGRRPTPYTARLLGPAIHSFNDLKFTLKHLKCSYMFRSYDHPQGAYIVPS